MLRTPKVRCDQGVIWHRVRGTLQMYVVVDGYVMLQGGPLYGSHLTTVDTKGEWQWVRQDLRKDMAWEAPHTVHVDYAAITGDACVAEAVAAVERPDRTDPEGPARDPLNLLLHHHPLRRLEAEAIRDAMLAVSGSLDRTVGGPSVEVYLTEF